MKPCIITYNQAYHCYEVYTESALCVCRRTSWQTVNDLVKETQEYEVIPNNTRFAKTILDKINQHHI